MKAVVKNYYNRNLSRWGWFLLVDGNCIAEIKGGTQRKTLKFGCNAK